MDTLIDQDAVFSTVSFAECVCVHGEVSEICLRFNPKWNMHWLRTKQNREWFASKACSQNSGFSLVHLNVMPQYSRMITRISL